MAAEKPVMKWQLVAWPKGPRFAKDAKGRNVSTALWRRDYLDESAAYRAAGQVHRMFPDAKLVIMPFTFKGWYWSGNSSDEVELTWCPGCNGRLNWVDDEWYCPRCGSEWHDEQIRPTENISN